MTAIPHVPAHWIPYFLVILSSLCFSGASVFFARFSEQLSPGWMNMMKTCVGWIGFLICTLFLCFTGAEPVFEMPLESAAIFLASGFVGLAVGDTFLFKAFGSIGSARTLMLFNFQPILLAIGGWIWLGQGLSKNQFFALIFLMMCMWTISYERYQQKGHWELKGLLFALFGVILDNVGVLMNRHAFDLFPQGTAFSANFLRFTGALPALYWFNRASGVLFYDSLKALPARSRALAGAASFFGTFISLALWLTALKTGHLAGLAGLGAFSPIASAGWEWIFLGRKPTRLLGIAFVFFLIGFAFILQS